MRTAIVGSRTITKYNMVSEAMYFLGWHKTTRLVVSGGATGVDTLARCFANVEGITLIEYFPDWKRHGKIAGFKRNSDIVENSDRVLAVWNGESKGTVDTIKKAKNKPVFIAIPLTEQKGGMFYLEREFTLVGKTAHLCIYEGK